MPLNIKKTEFSENASYQITSLDEYDVPGVAFDRKWSTIFTYQNANYSVGDTITLSTDNLDNFYINEIYVSLKSLVSFKRYIIFFIIFILSFFKRFFKELPQNSYFYCLLKFYFLFHLF